MPPDCPSAPVCTQGAAAQATGNSRACGGPPPRFPPRGGPGARGAVGIQGVEEELASAGRGAPSQGFGDATDTGVLALERQEAHLQDVGDIREQVGARKGDDVSRPSGRVKGSSFRKRGLGPGRDGCRRRSSSHTAGGPAARARRGEAPWRGAWNLRGQRPLSQSPDLPRVVEREV